MLNVQQEAVIANTNNALSAFGKGTKSRDSRRIKEELIRFEKS